jgi:hypothetical protein
MVLEVGRGVGRWLVFAVLVLNKREEQSGFGFFVVSEEEEKGGRRRRRRRRRNVKSTKAGVDTIVRVSIFKCLGGERAKADNKGSVSPSA